jgi:hypothetical protein
MATLARRVRTATTRINRTIEPTTFEAKGPRSKLSTFIEWKLAFPYSLAGPPFSQGAGGEAPMSTSLRLLAVLTVPLKCASAPSAARLVSTGFSRVSLRRLVSKAG